MGVELKIDIEKFALQTAILTNEQLGKLTRLILFYTDYPFDDKQVAQYLGQDKILINIFHIYKERFILTNYRNTPAK